MGHSARGRLPLAGLVNAEVDPVIAGEAVDEDACSLTCGFADRLQKRMRGTIHGKMSVAETKKMKPGRKDVALFEAPGGVRNDLGSHARVGDDDRLALVRRLARKFEAGTDLAVSRYLAHHVQFHEVRNPFRMNAESQQKGEFVAGRVHTQTWRKVVEGVNRNAVLAQFDQPS